jgi:hypothetical protein
VPDGSTEPSHYEILGVPPTASAEEIRAAFRAAARTRHPDAGGSPAAMRQLNAAWHVLSDPGRRALYDRARSGPAAPARDGAPEDVRQGHGHGDPPDRSEEWEGVAEDLLDDTPYGPTAAPQGWWALLPPATAALAGGLLLGSFIFTSSTLAVFAVAALFVAFGLFVLAPLRAMARPRDRSDAAARPSDDHR